MHEAEKSVLISEVSCFDGSGKRYSTWEDKGVLFMLSKCPCLLIIATAVGILNISKHIFVDKIKK